MEISISKTFLWTLTIENSLKIFNDSHIRYSITRKNIHILNVINNIKYIALLLS